MRVLRSRRLSLCAAILSSLAPYSSGSALAASSGNRQYLASATEQAFDTPAIDSGTSRARVVPVVPAGERTLWLEVSINGQAGHTLVEVLAAGRCADIRAECFSVSASDWRQLGLVAQAAELDEQGRVDFARLPDVDATYDAPQQRLLLTVPAVRFLPNTLPPPGQSATLPDPLPLNAVINYDLFAQTNRLNAGRGSYSGYAGLVGARLSDDWGQFKQSLLARGNTESREPLRRLDSSYRYDEPRSMTTWQAGDLVTAGLNARSALRIGGIQWRRDFALRPDLVTFPLPDFSGSAAVPTTVDIYVDQMRREQVDVPPGPFTLQQLPILTGPSQVQVVVRDALGREQVTTLELFASPQLLKPGLSDFAVQAGFARRNYGTDDDGYDDAPLASGSYRFGYTPTLTLETQAELARDFVLLSAGVAGLMGDSGQYEVLVAGSHDADLPDQSGAEISGRLDYYFDRQFVVNASFSEATRAFRELASRELPDDRPLSRQQFGAFHPLGMGGTVGVNWTRQRSASGQRFGVLSLTATQRVSERVHANLTGWRTLEGDDGWGALFLLSWFPGERENAGFGYQTGDTGSLGILSAQSSLPSDAGWGWQTELAEGRDRYVRGAVTNRNRYNDVSAQIEAREDSLSARMGALGALAWMPGTLKAGRQISDAYAMIDLGYPDVEVFQENRPVGHTGADGKLLVNNLNAYQSNRLGVDPLDLPMDVNIADAERRVVPGRGSGLRVDFGLEPQQDRLLALRLADGRWAPTGSRVMLPDGSARVVGYDGQTLVPARLAGLSLKVEIEARRCSLPLPEALRPDEQNALVLNPNCP